MNINITEVITAYVSLEEIMGDIRKTLEDKGFVVKEITPKYSGSYDDCYFVGVEAKLGREKEVLKGENTGV